MKINFTSFFLSAMTISGLTMAQPTIDAYVNPQVGESYLVHEFDVDGFNPGSNGANVTWDFSGLTSLGSNSRPVTSSADGLFGSEFPKADIAIFHTDSSGGHFLTDAFQYSLIGLVTISAQTKDNYSTDPREILRFPMTYLDVFNETFAGTQEVTIASVTYDLQGTATIEADAYGTLIMPYGTINDVLRVKVSSDYKGIFLGNPLVEYKDVTYFWFHPKNRNYICSYQVFELITNGSEVRIGTYMDETSVGIAPPLDEHHALTLYPNPAHDQLSLKFELNGTTPLQAKIYDIVGKEVKQFSWNRLNAGTQELTFDVKDLNSGVYWMQIQAGEVTRTTKFIRE